MEATAAQSVQADAVEVVNALGAAWSIFTLYPDPTGQPAFVRAITALAEPRSPMTIAVGPGGFAVDGQDLAGVRDGAERFARELFLNDVEALQPVRGATVEGVLALFREISSEGTSAASRLESIVGAGVQPFVRVMLRFDGTGDHAPVEEVRPEDAVQLKGVALEAHMEAPPSDIGELIRQTSVDAEDAAEIFLVSFYELYENVVPEADGDGGGTLNEGLTDPWKAVRTLVESFFFIPRDAQVATMTRVLAATDDPRHQILLDQFSGPELAGFLEDLPTDVGDVLVRYVAAHASDTGAAGEDLLGDLRSADDVRRARAELSSRVSDLVGSDEADVAARGPAPELAHLFVAPDPLDQTISVVRGLMECEERPDRFERIARIWTGRIARSVRAGEFDSANRLLRAVLENQPYVAAREPQIRDAMKRIAGRELLRALADSYSAEKDREHIQRILTFFGGDAVDRLVEQLAEEEDAQARRSLTELTAMAAADRPQLLEPHLSDKRWFVVRNLATVLGKTGRPSAVASLKKLLAHQDDRVKVEALRSLVRLLRDESPKVLVGVLGDPSDRVRHTALALLRSSEAVDLGDHVAVALEDASLDPAIGKSLIELAAARPTPAAIDSLKRIAARRFAVSGNARVLRDAAKRALDRMPS